MPPSGFFSWDDMPPHTGSYGVFDCPNCGMKVARNMFSQHECDEILMDQHHCQLFRSEWKPWYDSRTNAPGFDPGRLTDPLFEWVSFSDWLGTPQGRFAQVYAQQHR